MDDLILCPYQDDACPYWVVPFEDPEHYYCYKEEFPDICVHEREEP